MRLWFLIGLIVCPLLGCAPIPTSGSVDYVKSSQTNIAPLEEGQKIAVIPSKPVASTDMQDCMYSELSKKLGNDRMLDVETSYKIFYPIIEQYGFDQKTEKLREPGFKELATQNDIRYFVVVGEGRTWEEGESHYLLVGFLVNTTSNTSLGATVLDVHTGNVAVSVNTQASAASGGFVTIAVIYSVVTIPSEEYTACHKLGERLGQAFLTGTIETFEKTDKKGSDDSNTVDDR